MRGQIPPWDGASGADTWLGTESNWVGSVPAAGSRKIVKAASMVGTTDGSGLLTLTYPDGAFPNGIVTVVVTPGDNTGSLGYFQVPLTGQTLSQLKAYAWKATPNAVVVSGAVRANFIAYGW